MTINYTTEPTKLKQTYPWVGKFETESTHSTVLFLGPKHGFCLDSTDSSNMEERESFDWEEDEFIPCSVTLSSL